LQRFERQLEPAGGPAAPVLLTTNIAKPLTKISDQRERIATIRAAARTGRRRCRLIVAVLFGGVLSGCQLPGREGPVSQALIQSRQYSQQAIAAKDRSQWDDARQLLAKAVRSCPQDAEARRHYADVLWHQGARAEAVVQLEEAVRLTGDDASLHAELAQMRLELGQMEASARETEIALDLDPRLAAAWATRAGVMLAAGQPQQALADYHRALAYAPEDRDILLRIAEVYRQLRQPQRALATLQSLLETYTPGEEPQQVLYLTGLAYAALDRPDDAAEQFALALQRGPATPDQLWQLAEAQFRCGRAEVALSTTREALALDPSHAASLNLLRQLQTVAQVEPTRR